MNLKCRPLSLALFSVAAGGLITGVATAPLALAADSHLHAQTLPNQLRQPVTDDAGVLTGGEVAAIEDAINRLQDEKQLTLRVAYVDSFGGQTPEAWTKQAVASSGGGNVGVLAVDPVNRQYGLYGGTSWNTADLDALDAGVLPALREEDWGGAPIRGVESVLGQGEMSGDSAAWLGAGGVGAVAAGGGLWAYSRRQTKKRRNDALAASRELDPGATRDIASLPVDTLQRRSEEIIVSTDESVRAAQEELQIATSEFGPERTRPFLKALNGANSALQRAYQTRARLNDSIPETEPEQRAMYTDIISSCGQAQQALDAESGRFSELRSLIINADTKLDELTQRTVDLRARLTPASRTLAELRSTYSSEMLTSINDNDEMAVEALKQAESSLSRARDLQVLPAGGQAGLIDAIRESERAINLADSLLGGIEHGEENISAATTGLPALIAEVEQEIAEAAQLKQRGRSHGANADWTQLDETVAEARNRLSQARSTMATDPLSAHSSLMDIDSRLDEQLDTARETTQTQERQLGLFDQQLSSALSQLQGAEDLIASRGRLIGSQARTHLAEGQRLAAQAQHLRLSQTREATEYARAASNAAQLASQSANDDVRAYQRRQAANTGGQLIQGMVLGSLLSGGGRGGFGGGFGGGGGGFSGGGGGGFRGGGF